MTVTPRAGWSSSRMPLPAAHLPKAWRFMRALRRAAINYWYATLEGIEPASLEATTAAMTVNVLDEAVFGLAHGKEYSDLRAADRLGRVVTGLELIRNCEVHAPVVFEELLRPRAMLGVPSATGHSQWMRHVFAWASYDDLPSDYRALPTSLTPAQTRARKEALHGYREAVQDRSVIETIFDAMAFFQSLDDRLVADQPAPSRWAFAEAIPDTDPAMAVPNGYFLARPLGLDQWEVYLPDLACRWWERRSAAWPANDQWMKKRLREVRAQPPAAAAREVQYRVLDDSGALVGYSGTQPNGQGFGSWIERHAQVWRDVRGGYRYFIKDRGQEIELADAGHNCLVAPDTSGADRLATLPVASSVTFDIEGMKMVEEYPDLYLTTRRGFG